MGDNEKKARETRTPAEDNSRGISRRAFVQKAGKLTGAFAAGLFCLNGSNSLALANGRSGTDCAVAPVKMALSFMGVM